MGFLTGREGKSGDETTGGAKDSDFCTRSSYVVFISCCFSPAMSYISSDNLIELAFIIVYYPVVIAGFNSRSNKEVNLFLYTLKSISLIVTLPIPVIPIRIGLDVS